MAKLLMVDDDVPLTQTVADYMTDRKHTIEVAHDLDEGLYRLKTFAYDILLLDWQFPHGDGVEFCQKLRGMGVNMPIIMLTGKSTEDDKEAGLLSGADDYLTKPFSLRELSARIQALLRRAPQVVSDTLTFHDATIDFTKLTATKAGAEVKLNPKEFSLLHFMIRHPDRVFTIDELLNQVWSSESETADAAVTTGVSRLRRKLHPDIIRTVHGVGYVFRSE